MREEILSMLQYRYDRSQTKYEKSQFSEESQFSEDFSVLVEMREIIS